VNTPWKGPNWRLIRCRFPPNPKPGARTVAFFDLIVAEEWKLFEGKLVLMPAGTYEVFGMQFRLSGNPRARYYPAWQIPREYREQIRDFLLSLTAAMRESGWDTVIIEEDGTLSQPEPEGTAE